MKKTVSLFLTLAMMLCALFVLSACGNDEDVTFIETEYAGTTLYVANWGEYISDGSDDSLDVVKRFEKTYGITVKYNYYSTNEELYSQLHNDAEYDVVIPSDYMIEKLIAEDLLQTLDKNRLKHYDDIDEKYLGQYFDPTDAYSVPYAVGMVGIVYNTKLVDEADVASQSWDLLWNPKYGNGQIVNFNNPRDAFGVSMIHLGMDVNSTDLSDWEEAYNHLAEQDCIYLMDEVFNKMENGAASVAAYYAGDCITMMDNNPDLAFYYPKEGTNIFIDSMCIPKVAKNVGAAHLFIDFLLSEEIATANANFISYASPNKAVLENEEYAYRAGSEGYEILYGLPDEYSADPDAKMQYYHNLDDATLTKMNELWTRLGVEGSEDDGGGIDTTTVILIIIGTAVVVGVGGYYTYKGIRSYKAKKRKAAKPVSAQ